MTLPLGEAADSCHAELPAIGDFARATHMSVKTLRYYHRVGLLEPADVDPDTGYRRYTTAQIPAAQIIRRFRDLDMPVDEVRQVLAAPDLETRNELIAAHLNRLEEGLARTQGAVSSLRDLLARPSPPELADIGRLRVGGHPGRRDQRGAGHRGRGTLVPGRAR